jgi:hypothetical protein
MGRIKSALEIALERTESVKSDKASIGHFEAKQQGKRAAHEFLEGSGASLETVLQNAPKEQRGALKQGIFEALASQITLPLSKEDEKRIHGIGKGLSAIISDHRFAALYKQFIQAVSRYLDEADQYAEAIQRQYAPKLRQKEEEVSRRLGRQVKLDPLQDPEFVAFYNQHINALKENYRPVVEQMREQVKLLFDSAA